MRHSGEMWDSRSEFEGTQPLFRKKQRFVLSRAVRCFLPHNFDTELHLSLSARHSTSSDLNTKR